MTRIARACCLVLLGLLATLIATPSAPAGAAPTASISGTVTGAGGVLIPGSTEVYLYRQVGADGWVSVSPRVFADSSGHFQATGLVAGTYRLSFEAQGKNWLSEFWMDADTFETATDLTLAEGQQRTGIDAELRPAGHLTGTLHGPDGQVLRDVSLTAWPSTEGPPDGHGIGGGVGFSGQFDLGGLSPGTYRLQFEDEGGGLPGEFWNDRPTFATATDIVVGLGQVVALGDTVLGTPAPASAPVPTAPVVVNTAKPAISGRAVVGRVLKAHAGSWTPGGLAYAYRWFANGKAIKGATTKKLRLRPAQLGRKITVRVTAAIAGAAPVTVASKATKRVSRG